MMGGWEEYDHRTLPDPWEPGANASVQTRRDHE